jgi:hypothetical protein
MASPTSAKCLRCGLKLDLAYGADHGEMVRDDPHCAPRKPRVRQDRILAAREKRERRAAKRLARSGVHVPNADELALAAESIQRPDVQAYLAKSHGGRR